MEIPFENEPKTNCDCWLEVGKCYCVYPSDELPMRLGFFEVGETAMHFVKGIKCYQKTENELTIVASQLDNDESLVEKDLWNLYAYKYVGDKKIISKTIVSSICFCADFKGIVERIENEINTNSKLKQDD